jgi:heme A synthase
VLIRLRILHPVFAASAAIAIVLGARRVAAGQGAPVTRFARAVSALAVVQVTLGMLNVFLLAPVSLQLAHLLVADAVWIALILLGASVLGREPSTRAAAHAA